MAEPSQQPSPAAFRHRVRPREGGGSKVHIHVEMGFKGSPMAVQARIMMPLNGGGAETYRRWFMKTIAVLEREQSGAIHQ